MSELTKLGKYEIRRELGKGGMGIVYEGYDPLIERTVAIKTILKARVDKSEAQEVFSRFRREARAAGRLTHPKIVSIYEYDEDQDMAFIAMELIHGKELKEYFDDGVRFGVERSVRIMMQLLDALDYSHSRGVIHRDIKPANILITENEQVKVADFGIAKIESSLLTQVGSVLGTPTYMSPEQFKGLAVDRRTDVYSAGVILYQLLTDERPFTGSVISIMHKVMNKEAVPPSTLNPEVSKALDEVVKKAMAKRLEDRFQTAGEFMEALKLATSTRMEDTDATIIVPGGVSSSATPRVASSEAQSLQFEIELWLRIKSSSNAEDFLRYIQEFPEGEFFELAKLRIAALKKSEVQAIRAEDGRKREQAGALVDHDRKLAEAETRRGKEAKELKLREGKSAEARAAAEALRQREAEARARLEKRLVEIKAEAAETKVKEDAKRKMATEEQARRAKELFGIMADRSKKMAGIMADREAEKAAEAELEAETKRELEAEVKRKQETREQARRELAEAKVKAQADAKRKREAKE